jgi:hypothetical protein
MHCPPREDRRTVIVFPDMQSMVAGEVGETNEAILSGMRGMMVGDLTSRIGITRWISRQGNATTDFSLIGLHVD